MIPRPLARAHATTAVLVITFMPACARPDPPPEPASLSVTPTDSWSGVLERYQNAGGVDYQGLAADRGQLDDYLAYLADVEAVGGSRAQQMAFWINAYNAVVLSQVLELYPDVQSVKDVDGFFDELRSSVAGELLTLDEIEGRARELGDPRVHFAVVCASTSCPDLRHEPYRAADLERQLEEQTRAFLGNTSKGLRFDGDDGELWLSSIFKWYAGDFTGGSTVVAYFARGRLVEWLLGHLPGDQATAIAQRDPSVRYMDYDWGLNDRPLD